MSIPSYEAVPQACHHRKPSIPGGDGVLAYFGYPQASEHDAERAVRAGLALVEAIPGIDAGWCWASSRVSGIRQP
jgi:hypothetical protein